MTEFSSRAAHRVLCADRDPAMVYVLERIVRSFGMDPVAAGSGAECVSHICTVKDPFMAAIIDTGFQDVCVADILSEIDVRNPKTLVLLSCCSLDAHVQSLLDRDSRIFLRKPFTLDELRHKLQSAVS